MNRQIAIISCGTSPQVVTQTLWALSKRHHIAWSGYYIVTTETGRSLLCDPSFAQHWMHLQQTLGELLPLPFEQDRIITVPDEIDGTMFGSPVLDLLEQLTSQPDTTLHVSIVGGRKPMSVLLALWMSMFGRDHDRLYHLFAHPTFVASDRFFPEEHTSIAMLNWEIPFIRFRPWLEEALPHNGSQIDCGRLMLPTQQFFGQSQPQVVLDLPSKSLTVAGRTIKLRVMECAVYWWVASASEPIPWGKQLPDDEWCRFLKLYRSVSRLHHRTGQSHYTKDTDYQERYHTLQKMISSIRYRLKQQLPYALVERCSPRSVGLYADKVLTIDAEVQIVESSYC